MAWKGGHGPRRVLTHEAKQRRQVDLLERGDVLTHQPHGVRCHGKRGNRGIRVEAPDRRACVLERAVDRCGRGAQRLCGLLGGEAQHVAHHQRGALVGRQVVQHRGDSQLHRLPPLVVLVRRAAGNDVGPRRRIPTRSSPRPLDLRTSIDGRRPSTTTAQGTEAHVDRDAVRPGAERAASLEAVEPSPDADEHLLQGVLGILHGPEHLEAVAVELVAQVIGQQGPELAPSVHHTRPSFRLLAGVSRMTHDGQAPLSETGDVGGPSTSAPFRGRGPVVADGPRRSARSTLRIRTRPGCRPVGCPQGPKYIVVRRSRRPPSSSSPRARGCGSGGRTARRSG